MPLRITKALDMQVTRMTTRWWMFEMAVVALICAGLFTGSHRISADSLVLPVVAPFVLIFYVLARRLGLNTLFR